MSGLDKDRKRNQTIAFRVSPEERQKIEAKIKVCSMPKGEYFRRMALDGEIAIAVGRYESDRLSLELKRMREQLDVLKGNDELKEKIEEVKALFEATRELIQARNYAGK